MSGGLTGHYHVIPTSAAIHEAEDLFPRFGDYQQARSHALKLRFGPASDPNESGQVVDVGREWIKSMPGAKVDELRIDDVIGGCDNLCLIFYVSDLILPGDAMPKIWILSVLQKKSNSFTTHNLATFRGRLTILKKRVYENH
jgi:hypothetical protein